MQTHTQKTLSIFWNHAKRYPWHVFGIAVGVVAHVALNSYNPLLFKKIIDALSLGNSPENVQTAIRLVFVMLGVSVARMGFARGFNFINNYFQPKVMADLNNTCFQYLQKHSYDFFNNSFVGSLVTKVKRYERAFEQLSDQLTFDLGRTSIETIVILSIIFFQNKTIGLISLAWLIAYVAFSYYYSLYKLPWDIKRAAADTRVTAQLADSITNNFNVKTFSNYGLENKRFDDVTESQFRLRKKSWDLGTIGDFYQAASMIAAHTLIIYLCVRFWQGGALSIGTIVLIETYWFRLSDKLWNVGKYIRTIYEAIADANEMTEILLKPHKVRDASGAFKLKAARGAVEYINVTFTYNQGLKILENFNLKIEPGQKVAVIGPSGAGKSTIVKLLARFYDLDKGEILIDGQNIANATQDSLRLAMSLVPQEPVLFHRSLMENIRYARPGATDEEVVTAAKLAHAHEFIDSFPDKYNTLVGERGIKLSGGERQRVAIARAILKDAPILVLDEATSSLDSESEHYIQDALKSLMKNKTAIVIAHRLSTIMQMDRIVVLENGQITEEGKHKELLKMREGTYQRLWHIQAGGFV